MKLLTLEEWANRTYSDSLPSIKTLRRWARNGNFYPAPEKHGRTYRIREDAIYINPKNYRLSKQIVADNAMVLSPLMDRLLNGKPPKKK
ncbi:MULTISPECIES: excisionase [Serratia]|uniref:excisionase n=1 Tax=Serratia TaxID=613 RepID=UPI0036F448B1